MARHQTNAKNHERRVCQALGGQRNGPNPGSDCVGTAYSVECKRMVKLSLRAEHIEQAKRQSVVDGKPWLLCLQEHGDEAYVLMPFKFFVETLHPLKRYGESEDDNLALEFGRWQEAAEQGEEVRWYDEVRDGND